jgi:hypothetical protein
MAKERVQVQGLGDVVPGIQPTIQRAGQYAVAQVRAAPVPVPRSKLLDLADTLKVGQDLLQQYGLAAKQEAEMFEEELSRKSPEEIQAMLKKTEGELDKQVRRGAMGWLTSPLNQKRKLRAVGRAASRALMVDITTRLENPLADDPDDGLELASMLQQEYISNNPALANSVFAQEGLQEAINPQVQQLVVNFERKKAAIAKRESGLAVTSNFFDTIETLLSSEGYQEGSIQSGVYKDKLKEIWAESNAHTPDEQRAIFKATLSELAKQGMKNEAEELLIFAQQELKFGNAPMSEVEQNNYEDFIEDVAEKAEKDLEQDQLDTFKLLSAEAYNAIYDIKTKKQGDFNGNSYTTIAGLQKAIDDFDGLDEENKARLRKSFLNDVTNFKTPSERRAEQTMFKVNRELLQPKLDTNILTESISDSLQVEFANAADVVGANPQIIEQAYFEAVDELRDKADELSLEYDDPIKLEKALRPFVYEKIKEKEKQIRDAYRNLATTDKNKKEFLTQTMENAGDEKVIEPSWWDSYLTPYKKLEPTYQVERLKNLVSVSLNEAADFNEVRKAYKILKDTDLNNLVDIANGRKPMAVKLKPQVDVPLARSLPFTPTLFKTTPRERNATVKERDEIKGLLKQAMIPLGGYMNIRSLEEEHDPLVGKFNPLALDARFIPILTKEEIDEGKDSAMVKRKAKAIGREDELDKFFNEQLALYKKHIKNKRPYPNPGYSAETRSNLSGLPLF